MTKFHEVLEQFEMAEGVAGICGEGCSWNGFHQNWYDEFHTVLPHVRFAGWGDRYTGGTIEYRGKRRFLDVDDIVTAVEAAAVKGAPLTKKETFEYGSDYADGSAAGRAATFGII